MCIPRTGLVLVGQDNIILVRSADVRRAHAGRGRIVGRSEMQRLQPLRCASYGLDVVEAKDTLDDDFKLDLLLAPDSHLGLRDQHVDRIDISRNAHLWDHEKVQPLARLLHDVDDIAIAPRRIQPIDPDGNRLGPEIDGLEAFDDVGARLRLVRWRDTVLKIKTDHVGIRRSRLLEQLGPNARNKQLRPVQARLAAFDLCEAHCTATPS